MPGPVIEALRRNWWTFIFRGVCAIAFGFFAWFWPGNDHTGLAVAVQPFPNVA